MQARNARDLKRAEEEFEEAESSIEEAFEEIEASGNFNPNVKENIDQATKDQARELADCWGIRGGIYREEGKIREAIDAYDNGYQLESETRYEIHSTYNTVNRLVLRLLTNPNLLKQDSSATSDSRLLKPLPELLADSARAIAAEWRNMTDPVWSLADMVLIKSILESPDETQWEELFKAKANNRFPFDSLGTVVKTLAKSELPISETLNQLAQRLDEYATERWPLQKG